MTGTAVEIIINYRFCDWLNVMYLSMQWIHSSYLYLFPAINAQALVSKKNVPISCQHAHLPSPEGFLPPK